MTEVVVAKGSTPVVIAGVAALAVLDPSITNIVLALIAAIVTIMTLWFAFKTSALDKKNHEKDIKLAEKDARLKALETPIKEKEKLP